MRADRGSHKTSELAGPLTAPPSTREEPHPPLQAADPGKQDLPHQQDKRPGLCLRGPGHECPRGHHRCRERDQGCRQTNTDATKLWADPGREIGLGHDARGRHGHDDSYATGTDHSPPPGWQRAFQPTSVFGMPSGSIDASHPTLSSLSVLDRAKADQVVALCELCENHDGVAPLNEQALLTLSDGKIHDGIAHVIAEIDDQIVAYALLDSAIPDPQLGALSVAQFMVHPQHRRRGIAWQMAGSLGFDVRPEADADQAERHRAGLLISAWSFGNLPSARTWAEKYGADAVRQLLIMRRPATEVPAPRFDAGFTVRPFVEADMAQMLEVNALAFAHHPEQGQMSADDVRARMSEDWFDPEGFLVLEHQERVIGFHWTKQHSAQRGEVYVIGIHPEWGGRGLGRHLLNAGMQHLVQRGVDEIILYVEGDLEHVVRLYRTSGFEVINTDVLYRTTNRT